MGPRSTKHFGNSRLRYSIIRSTCLILLSLGCALTIGCASNREAWIRRATTIASIGNQDVVRIKPVQRTVRFPLLSRLTGSAPPPSERTGLLLRRYNLQRRYDDDPDDVIQWLQELAKERPTLAEIYGLAEIAEIQANRAAQLGDDSRATRLYAIAVVHAYQFLFDPKLDISRNAYDPQFRSICDVYNRSLEGLLRVVCHEGGLQPNQTVSVGGPEQGFQFDVRIEGRWKDEKFDRFELVNDFEASGLDNHYHTYGLGVPLIGIRKKQSVDRGFEKYYPPDLTMPMTAFMRLPPDLSIDPASGESFQRAELTLYDPLERTQVRTETTVVPLESDITTPLAYALKDPLLSQGVLATASMLNANFAPETYGMYMLEPFDPNKIPVVMVHGLWSSPVTWVHMFNDLRANRDIHENYQFWFYSYPTGQPFWISAQQMRRDLATVRRELDPGGDSQSLDQMILVGHSMGGLVSTMQTIDSGDQFWETISEESFDDITGDPELIQTLRDTFYFHPNPSIDRVITIATPFRGSQFANRATQWISQKIITLPALVTEDFQALVKQNLGKFKPGSLITMTSVDSLSPTHPVFAALATAQASNTVKFHNVMGRLPKKLSLIGFGSDDASQGDGVVSLESANNETSVSQVYVSEEHSKIHQHPACIYEVRRILLENLAEHDRIRVREIPALPTIQQAARLEPVDASNVSEAAMETQTEAAVKGETTPAKWGGSEH